MTEQINSAEDAAAYSAKLRKQGITYPEIAKSLEKMGYKSGRTKRPLTAMTVRHLVTQLELADNKEISQQTLKFSGTPALDKIEAVKQILKIKTLDNNKKLSIVTAILE